MRKHSGIGQAQNEGRPAMKPGYTPSGRGSFGFSKPEPPRLSRLPQCPNDHACLPFRAITLASKEGALPRGPLPGSMPGSGILPAGLRIASFGGHRRTTRPGINRRQGVDLRRLTVTLGIILMRVVFLRRRSRASGRGWRQFAAACRGGPFPFHRLWTDLAWAPTCGRGGGARRGGIGSACRRLLFPGRVRGRA